MTLRRDMYSRANWWGLRIFPGYTGMSPGGGWWALAGEVIK